MVSSIGWRLVDVFQDPGSSSETLARPEMQRLMACAEHGQFEHVVVYAVDRLTRRLFDFARLIELFDKSGVKLTVGNGKSEYHVVHKFGFKLKTGHSLMSGPSVVELQARLIPRQSSCL
jgi:predicted site-specific integrase-resolvase